MRSLIIIACLALAAAARSTRNVGRPELDDDWESFKQTYAKNYDGQHEEDLRRIIWESNYDFMQQHNAAHEAGDESFSVGENEFNDLTNEEFVTFMNGFAVDENRQRGEMFTYNKRMALPDSVNWTAKGYVTPVKNQKQCGSCWAFSATGSLEAAHFKATKKLVSLSEQNLVDCSMAEGNHGCFGGLMDFAFKYIKKNGGIDTEASYPYKAENGKCKFSQSNVGATLSSWMDIKRDSEDDLKAAVATVGPVSVGIDAGHPGFQMYKSGVFTSKVCSSVLLDHGVLAVGYGSETGKDGSSADYWLVKNSWGASWGDSGYIKMARNKNNMCGIATAASYPVV